MASATPPNSSAPDDIPSKPKAQCPDRLHADGESPKAYEAFQAYFELGNSRTIPTLVKHGNFSLNSLYRWAKTFHWDERVDSAYAEASGFWRNALKKRFEELADELAHHKIVIFKGNIELTKLAQKKAMEIMRGLVVQEVEGQSADGKTIILKPAANIRMTDAVRLMLAANAAVAQTEQMTTPKKLLGKQGQKADGSPIGNVDTPILEFFLDDGSGNPTSVKLLPPPDELDPDAHPDSDGTTEPTQNAAPES